MAVKTRGRQLGTEDRIFGDPLTTPDTLKPSAALDRDITELHNHTTT